jgi:uncharacterized membrane protein YbhN (UPF0104 family)
LSAVAAATPAPPPAAGHPVRRILFIVACIVAIGAAAYLLGWDITGWCEEVWDTITGISAEYIVASLVVMTIQTTATAFGWYTILRYAYPGEVVWMQVLAAYSTCVALNNILPANLGTIVMFVMLTTVIASATFGGVVTGFFVQKIFFTVAACFVYLYLFLSVPGSFDISFEWIKDHPWAVVILVAGVLVALGLLVWTFWPKVVKFWERAKAGGQVLLHPGAYFGRVFLPSFVGWVAGLCNVAIFMAAYSIPITFHTVMTVTGSNSIANSVSVTPGGAGVQQAFNVKALGDVTDSTTATAYSVSQQLVSTAWHIVMAVILLIWVFGWAGGKALVRESYAEAKVKAAEQKAAREAKKAAKRSA